MVEVEWGNPEKSIVLWKFSSPWTWNEFFDAKKQVDGMIDTVNGIVDSIFLTSKEQKIPADALSNFRKLITSRHQRHDVMVLVGSSMFLSSILNIVIKVMPGVTSQMHFVNSPDEAHAIIAKAQTRRQQNTPSPESL